MSFKFLHYNIYYSSCVFKVEILFLLDTVLAEVFTFNLVHRSLWSAINVQYHTQHWGPHYCQEHKEVTLRNNNSTFAVMMK